MAKNLGDKIKAARKELKMTQTDLAGSEMTKSMLSQIENNLAMPSMKNLQYLASKLGKPMAYFLEDSTSQAALPMDEINEEIKSARDLMNMRKTSEALERLEAILTKYKPDHDSKLYADLLDKCGQCLVRLNRIEEGELKIKEAIDIYSNNFLYIDAAKAYLSLMDIPWNNFDYSKCMVILTEALNIYSSSINKDYAFEIEALYIRSVLYAGLDQPEQCKKAAQEALDISKRTNIYYRSDELYKNLAVMNFFLDNLEDFDKHLNKAKQFAAFTENKLSLASIEWVHGMYENRIGDYKKALEYLEKAKQISEDISAFVYTEKSKALLALGEYQEVLSSIKLISYPKYTPFKYDYLHIWSSKIYEGLALNKLNMSETALGVITEGIEKLEVVGESKALAFAFKSLSEVYSDMGDYEKAFAALRKSNEISEIAKENKLYY